ncbi:MAG: electron transport complex subunit E [Oscillospiraceae bacterium]|jgi:electron transport complex protein RnfE|nr:electron transport complex subunit E [Oscillospiraceae bacterium]
MKRYLSILKDGLIRQNPVFVLLLGMCPTMATSTSLSNAIGMGFAATLVLICSNLFISLLRKIIPDKIRIASYVIVIAGFVTLVEMLVTAYFPDIAESLGVFLPLIVVNCIILARAEAFASKNTPMAALADGLSMGLGFTLALCVMSFIRELLGSGALLGNTVLPEGFPRTLILTSPPGGFLTLGCVIALMQFILRKQKGKGAAS